MLETDLEGAGNLSKGIISCRNHHTGDFVCLGCFVSPNIQSCFLASLSRTVCFPTVIRKQGRSSLLVHPAGIASSCSLEQQQELASFQPASISAEVNELGKNIQASGADYPISLSLSFGSQELWQLGFRNCGSFELL